MKRTRVLQTNPLKAEWDDFFYAPGIDLGERSQPLPQCRDGRRHGEENYPKDELEHLRRR